MKLKDILFLNSNLVNTNGERAADVLSAALSGLVVLGSEAVLVTEPPGIERTRDDCAETQRPANLETAPPTTTETVGVELDRDTDQVTACGIGFSIRDDHLVRPRDPRAVGLEILDQALPAP